MTLLGAVDLGGSMLIAADSGVFAEGEAEAVWQERKKIYELGSLRWGFTGEAGMGLAFKNWLENQPAFDSWDSLHRAAVSILAEMNGRSRQNYELAQTPKDERYLTEVVLCGYLGSPPEGRILALNEDGSASYAETNPAWLGSGLNWAAFGWELVNRGAGAPSNAEELEGRFRFIVENTVQMVVTLRHPPDYLTVLEPGVPPGADAAA